MRNFVTNYFSRIQTMISKLIRTSILLTIISSCSSNSNIDDKDKATLKNLEMQWLVAEFKADTAAIAKLMDERFISIGPFEVSNKKAELEAIFKNITERIAKGNIVEDFYFDDFNVLFHENSAVVTFACVSKGKNGSTPFENRRTRIYDVWIKKNNRWQAISSQVTPIK